MISLKYWPLAKKKEIILSLKLMSNRLLIIQIQIKWCYTFHRKMRYSLWWTLQHRYDIEDVRIRKINKCAVLVLRPGYFFKCVFNRDSCLTITQDHTDSSRYRTDFNTAYYVKMLHKKSLRLKNPRKTSYFLFKNIFSFALLHYYHVTITKIAVK